MGKSITRYLFTDRVKEEMVRRNIEESEIGSTFLRTPIHHGAGVTYTLNRFRR